MGFPRGGVGGHYYCWVGGVRGGGQVGVVHERDVGVEGSAGCEVELGMIVSLLFGYWGEGAYKSSVLQTLHYVWR